MHGRQSPAYGASSLRARSRDPRGAYAPRSWSCRRSCIAKVAFSPSREGRPPGAAGVSPPWLDDAHARKIANRKWVHIHAASGAAGVSPPCVAVATLQRRSTRHSHLVIAPGNRSGGRQTAVARRRTCKENRKPQVGAHSHSISSGGRQPAVVLETYLHTRFRNRSADCRPVRWRTPLQPRSCNYAELTPPALGAACVRWCRANVCGIFLAGAFRQATGGSRPPLLVVPAFAGRRNCDFCDAQTHTHRSGGCEPAVCCGSDSATTIHQTFARYHRAREQQRRASARRGSTTHMQGKSQTTSRCAFT